MNEEHDQEQQPDGSAEKEYETLLASYVDRLIEGSDLETEAILNAHPDCGDQLLQDLQSFISPSPVVSDEPLGTLGDYTLRCQIGRGGMGIVYDAWQQSMDRRVALKVLPAGTAADTKAWARFMREAQLTGKLNHQNVVYVFGMGVEEQTPYYAMEYVEGETLAQIVARLRAADGKEEERSTIIRRVAQILGKGAQTNLTADVRPDDGVGAAG